MRLLITGGAGFIGSALARRAIADGHDVLVVDKLTYAGHLSSLRDVADHPRYAFVQADVCDGATLTAVLARFHPDAVAHLAAESHVDRSIDAAADFITTNIVGTFTLLEAVRGYTEGLIAARRDAFRFLHVSTDEVFGSLGSDGAFTETTRYDPRSPYAASKAASDHLVRAWGHTYGVPALVSNCSNNYGPYQLPEKLIPLMILNGLEGRALPVYGDGLQRRDWLHVDDHADALLVILERGGVQETYAVGPREERANLEVVQRVCDLLDSVAPSGSARRDLIAHVADRPGHDQRYAIDPGKMERELDWRAQTRFDEGIERTVRWYVDTRWWWGLLRAAGHGGTRLGRGEAS